MTTRVALHSCRRRFQMADVSRDLHSVTVFPTAFAKAYMKIEEGNAYKFKFGKTKDGTTILEDINA